MYIWSNIFSECKARVILFIGLAWAVHSFLQVWTLSNGGLLFSVVVLGYSGYVYLWQMLTSLRYISRLFLYCRHSLLQSVRLCLLGKANTCANRHAQLCCFCHGIQSDMLTIYHSPAYLLCTLLLSFPAL